MKLVDVSSSSILILMKSYSKEDPKFKVADHVRILKYKSVLAKGDNDGECFFCGMVERQKVFSLISSWNHCQRFLPLRISGSPQEDVFVITKTKNTVP